LNSLTAKQIYGSATQRRQILRVQTIRKSLNFSTALLKILSQIPFKTEGFVCELTA